MEITLAESSGSLRSSTETQAVERPSTLTARLRSGTLSRRTGNPEGISLPTYRSNSPSGFILRRTNPGSWPVGSASAISSRSSLNVDIGGIVEQMQLLVNLVDEILDGHGIVIPRETYGEPDHG